MNDQEINALATEARTIAKRLHADWRQLGDILSTFCDTFGEPERLRRRDLFTQLYFDDSADIPDELYSELAADHDYDLWTWERQSCGGFDRTCLPPLPVADELRFDLADEFGDEAPAA